MTTPDQESKEWSITIEFGPNPFITISDKDENILILNLDEAKHIAAALNHIVNTPNF